jgi:hypothetical protein
MFDSVPNDMQNAIDEKFINYVNCLKAGSELPSYNLAKLQDNYTKLLTMRLRAKMPVTMARRIAKNLMSSYFENLMRTVN